MAKIEVIGVATRLFFQDKGVEVTEFAKGKDGATITRKYTAWFENPVSFREGAEGTFSGSLSATIDKWTNADGSVKLDREGNPGQSVKVSINGTVFTPSGNAAQPTSSASAILDESMPF
jgi:hypothetical protein